ncbi:MAG: hypothetical protein V3V10_06725, partial [Planctomycetota bacterium]
LLRRLLIRARTCCAWMLDFDDGLRLINELAVSADNLTERLAARAGWLLRKGLGVFGEFMAAGVASKGVLHSVDSLCASLCIVR